MNEHIITRPYPNEHAARMHDPGAYDHFRRENDKFGKGINVIWGIKKDGTTEVQAIRFDAKKFTPAEAKKWLKDHDYKPIQFEEAAKEARMNSRIAWIWEGIQRLFEPELGKTPPTRTRTMAMQQLMGQVGDQMDVLNDQNALRMDPQTGPYYDPNEYMSPMDVYYDDDESLFALATRAGKIYRIPVTVAGDNVALGAAVEIPLTGRTSEPPKQSMTVIRTADGTRRWFAIAASAVLNRINEIDSTKLFDNFITRAKVSGVYPVLSFYHMPDVIRLGQADWLAREGYLYLASGTFDDTEIARTAADQIESGKEAWGDSIGYLPIGEPNLLEVMPDINIPVYNDGINREISVVLERDAAAWFTRQSTEEVRRTMTAKEYDALKLMFGEEKAKALAAQIDGTNRTIEERDLIRRTQETAPVAPVLTVVPVTPVAPVAPVGPVTPAPDQKREFVLDDAAITAIVEKITASDLFKQLQTGLATLTAGAATLDKARSVLEIRLAKVERTEAEKQREWQADLPKQPTVVSYRPREAHAGKEGEASAKEVADATLANMKTRNVRATR